MEDRPPKAAQDGLQHSPARANAPRLDGMARFLRATLLLTALGVAAPVLPASTAAAANTGGAAPGSSVTASSAATGGAGMGTTQQPAADATPPKGAAAPGVQPAQKSTSKTAGGALPGRKPPRKAVPRQTPKPPAKTPKSERPPKQAPTVPTVAGVFPLMGAFDFGGEDARFGAGRPGHIHQGQDVIAARGTPIVAPVAGSILWKANQEAGAGIYLILRATDGRDYAFMHIKRGTVQVAVGDTVSAGQQLAQVGSTGASSGPHLHFESWIGGWYVKGGMPVDPLPQLQRWAGLPASS